MIRSGIAGFVLFVLLLSGCKGGGGERLIPVEGKVLLEGKVPLTKGGSVAFHPDAQKNSGTKVPAGKIDESGTYTLYTDGKPGAPAGWYKVTVVSTSEPDSGKPDVYESYVAKFYKDQATTPFTIEVKEGAAAGSYDLRVMPK